MKKELFIILSTGFALFSMFFGSGNLIFPIAVGVACDGHIVIASLGVLCTCVLFPLLGMFAMMLYKGSIPGFFSCFGKTGVFLFSFLSLALMGPFGVLARCLTVIHGACLLLFPTISIVETSFFICVVIYVLTANKNRIVPILGSLLTPLLLLAIGFIVFFALKEKTVLEETQKHAWDVFKHGFFTGYQTMDLVASFFFSGFVIKYLCDNHLSHAKGLKSFIKSGLIAAAILYVVYFSLILLGWIYAPLLVDVRQEEMLGKIALLSLGSHGALAVCFTVIFACLTTAIALTSMFAEFLQREVAKEKINMHAALAITLVIAFLVSTLEFSGIAGFLGPILETIYPALISLTAVNIACKYLEYKSSHWAFTLTLAAKLCMT